LEDFFSWRIFFQQFPVEMADNGSSRAQLSNAASFIKICSRDWRLGEKKYSTGTTAVEKLKMS
jgi:hypothetical protein